MEIAPTPLEPERFFAQRLEGVGELRLRGPLARLPGSRRFSFSSFATMITEDFWVVHDEARWDDGRIELRDGLCRRLDETTLRMTYDDMVGGTTVRLRADGFDFEPYTMLVAAPGAPMRMPVRCNDHCQLEADGTLVDTIELKTLGVRIGHLVMRLRTAA